MKIEIAVLLAVVSLASAFGSVRLYRGEIDFASNNVVSVFELVSTNSKQVKSVECNTTSATGLWVSISGIESDCSDASNDILLSPSGIRGFALDNFPVGTSICVQTDAGTASAGSINCLGWWEGVAP